MMIDLTLPVSAEMRQSAGENLDVAKLGHVGTHFDVMNKPFPLEYLRRPGVVFDVAAVAERDIAAEDIEPGLIKEGMFVAFRTGGIERSEYGSKAYFGPHPQLAMPLIELLLQRGAAIIGVDCAGVRRGAEHTRTDQYCADHGTFVVENLAGLPRLLGGQASATFTAYTFPIHYLGMTGLPCRVVAEVAGA